METENLIVEEKQSFGIPSIKIKTDNLLKSKRWSRYAYWAKKNLLLSVIAFIVTTCFVVSIATSNARRSNHLLPHQKKLAAPDTPEPDYVLNTYRSKTKVKAAFVVIAREEDLYGVQGTILDLERRFNIEHGYPWVIIGYKPFSKHFRDFISDTTRAPVSFGVAPSIEFNEPYWIDLKLAEDLAKVMTQQDTNKGQSMQFRRMTRYVAGFLAFHPLLKDLDYYWKVQPGSRYDCNVVGDPFLKMQEENKKLSFILTATENHLHITHFKETVDRYIRSHQGTIVPVMQSIWRALLSDDGLAENKLATVKTSPLGLRTGHWSNCMISNTFSIVSLNFLRSKDYNTYFDALDKSGGFFYERWGDSFPLTVAAALLLRRDEINHNDIEGYSYGGPDFAICPKDVNLYADLKCTCDPKKKSPYQGYCTPKFIKAIEGTL